MLQNRSFSGISLAFRLLGRMAGLGALIGILSVTRCASSREEPKKPVNRLAQSNSPYLRSAAHQLVHWYEWSEEAFAAAKAQDKPILLDIGAVWCHWCHVIDRESYEDAEIARIINEGFIPVKVDVDARPDIDRRYQEVVQALSGQGGWPLTVFLTPEGQVIYGGTYFPPEDRLGMPGMKAVLNRVAQVYRDNKAEVTAQAKQIHEELGRVSVEALHPGELEPGLLDRFLTNIQNHFDDEHGGFGDAPKFPSAAALEFLLHRFAATGEKRSLQMVTKTLDAMAELIEVVQPFPKCRPDHAEHAFLPGRVEDGFVLLPFDTAQTLYSSAVMSTVHVPLLF